MSFVCQRAIYYLIDPFQYYMQIRCIKTLMLLKRQQFEDNKSHEIEPKI